MAYHLANAITGVSPNFTFDYTKLKFSSGKLLLPDNIVVAITAPARVDFTWLNTGPNGKYKDATDSATVVVYNPVKDSFVTLQGAAVRSALGYNLLLPADYSGDEVYCYISFTSVISKKLASNSFYVGQFLLL
ncbi:hypothetical protein D3C86_1624490 [compost metagenome]